MASEDSRARSVSDCSVDPALISTDVVGSNPSECKLELAIVNTQIKYAMSINRDIDEHVPAQATNEIKKMRLKIPH